MKKVFKIIGLTLLVLFLSTITIFLFLIRDYKGWERSFELGYLSSDFVFLNNESLKTSVEKKIEDFSKSSKKVDFVELTDRETLFLIGESLNESLPFGMVFDRGYVSSDDGQWDIYAKVVDEKYKKGIWMKARLLKDNLESPEIFVQTISVGNYDFKDYGLGIIVWRVNRGIRESISLVNTSEFTGRTIKNIELEKGVMTVKGER